MSGVTKIFIVLLVFLSVITTSATIVYVNKEDQMRTASKKIAEERDAKQAQVQNLEDQIAAMQGNLQNVQNAANEQSTRATAEQLKLQQDISRLKQLLELTRGNISEIARISGRYRADIYRLLAKHGVEWEEFRP